jgi:hypothetical protein
MLGVKGRLPGFACRHFLISIRIHRMNSMIDNGVSTLRARALAERTADL